jgi:hypothetical protein
VVETPAGAAPRAQPAAPAAAPPRPDPQDLRRWLAELAELQLRLEAN